MRQIITFLLFTLSINLLGQTKVADLSDCLNESSTSPKEYILNLFKTNDIIIIGERDHRDTTQYNLLLDIFSDEKFIHEVGYIYTEVGCTNRTQWTNRILKSTYKNDADFDKQLIKLYRELDFNPLWEKYNMYKYLKGIYSINKTLKDNEKLTIGLTDLAFDWKGMSRKKYSDFENILNAEVNSRDSIMAENFIRLFENQIPKNGKRKALVILSFPHAIKMDLNPYGSKLKRTGSYIADKYKERVKIVAFNSIYFGKYNSNNRSLIDSGKWDAAFEKTSCNPVGFDIKDTPFGTTVYEEGYGTQKTFQEIMDGIIFYFPFYNFKCTVGIPNVVDKSFSKELMRRTILSQDKFINRMGLKLIQPFYKKANANYYNKVRTFQCGDNELLKKEMNKWIN